MGAIGCALLNIPFAIVLVLGGFYLAYHSEAKLTNHGEVFASIESMAADAVKTAAEGDTVKLRGMPAPDTLLKAEHYDKDVIFYRRTLEEYVREEDDDGVSYDWETQSTEEKFAGFTVDGVRVRPRDAKIIGAREVFQGVRSPAVPPRPFKQIPNYNPSVGDERLSIEIIDAGQELSVFGDIENAAVHGGSTFIISALSDDATASALNSEYRTWYWVSKLGALLAIAVGLLMLGSPLSALVGSLTGGSGGSCGFAAICFTFAGMAVLTISLLSRNFVGALAVIIAAAILTTTLIARNRKKSANAEAQPSYVKPAEYTSTSIPTPVATPAEPPLTTPQQHAPQRSDTQARFCIACGAQLPANAEKCPNCGTKPAS